MSFRAAQDHKKAVSRVTTLSTPSSSRREDPMATTRNHSSCFAFACCSFSFGFAYRELYCLKVVELILLLLVVNYICCGFAAIVNYIGVVYDLFLYSLVVLEAPRLGR
jgi:hypothetical protein